MSFFFCKQKTAYEVRISDWSSDVCSSDLENLLQEPAEDVVLAAHRPEQAGKRDVDADQDGREEVNVTAEQPEPAIDVTDEGLHELVDDVQIVHGVSAFVRFEICRGALAAVGGAGPIGLRDEERSEEHTSELQSLMRISTSVLCL